jgi:hypothetical protein
VSGTVIYGGSCEILPLGKGLYIHVETGNGQPIDGAFVPIYFASPICPNVSVSVTEQILTTNATGWTNYTLDGAGRYNFDIQYSSKQYSFSVLEMTNQTTYATVELPSGNLTTMYVP